MTERETLKLALEAYLCREMPAGTIIGDPKWWASKIAMAVREALAQPEQEPVVWMYQDKTSHAVKFQRHMSNFVDHSKTSEIPLYSEPLANHELQCVCGAVWCGDEMVHLPNKIPPQRKPWVGLTEQEHTDIAVECGCMSSDWVFYGATVERLLKEKNS